MLSRFFHDVTDRFIDDPTTDGGEGEKEEGEKGDEEKKEEKKEAEAEGEERSDSELDVADFDKLKYSVLFVSNHPILHFTLSNSSSPSSIPPHSTLFISVYPDVGMN